MSGENLAANLNAETEENVSVVVEKTKSKISNRVDINNLMSKVREQERKERKENLIFFSLISSVILITGIIASL
jgi:hypothetical protein